MPVIAAIDFSPLSARAANLAYDWADRLGQPLVLAHVVSLPSALPTEVGTGMAVFSQALRELGDAQIARLRAGRERGPEVTMNVLFGKPDEALAELTRSADAALLVMGTHGREGLERLFLGSVAERVVQQAACPVLVVPQAKLEERVEHGRRNDLRVLAAVGPGPAGRAVHDFLNALRAREAVDVTFLHAYDAEAEHARLGIDGPYAEVGDDAEVVSILRRELAPVTEVTGSGPVHVVVRSRRTQEADPVSAEAELAEANLIVLGVGASGRRTSRPGRAAATLRAATVPVLCVPARAAQPEAAPAGAALPPELRRVLVATDLSEAGNRAVARAYQVLRAAGGRVDLLHAAPGGVDGLPPGMETEIARALEALVPAAASAHGIRTQLHVVASAAPREAILQAAERLQPDLLVLGTHGRGGVARAVLGSVADGVVRGARQPVLLVGPEAA